MPGLIDPELATTGERHVGEDTPPLILDRAALNAARLHRLDQRVDVVAHQVELVHVVLVGGVQMIECAPVMMRPSSLKDGFLGVRRLHTLDLCRVALGMHDEHR